MDQMANILNLLYLVIIQSQLFKFIQTFQILNSIDI